MPKALKLAHVMGKGFSERLLGSISGDFMGTTIMKERAHCRSQEHPRFNRLGHIFQCS